MLGAIVTKGTFPGLKLHKIPTSVTTASMHSVILPEPESSQTPPHPSSADSPHQHLQLLSHHVLSIFNLKSRITTNVHRGQKDKLNKADPHEVYGLVGKQQTGEQIPFLKRASTI